MAASITMKKLLLRGFLIWIPVTLACRLCYPVSISRPLTVMFNSDAHLSSGVGFAAGTQLLEQQPLVVFGAALLYQELQPNKKWITLSRNQLASKDDASPEDTDESQGTDDGKADAPAMSSAMIASIGFYKNWISPILPPACRFVPTCSQYGVAAISKYGPTKGAILTAWRILRCSPLGGKGYDPPRWPPVAYTYSSY